jgi:LmbE family N-acetylglucosaminyl deacetylase
MNKESPKTILIISPHPDDETLGCGGTIFKHKNQGDKVYWLIMTAMKVEDGYTESVICKRKKEINRVVKEYNFDGTFPLGYSTRKLDLTPVAQIVKDVSDVVHAVAPNVVYVPFCHDVHTDHRITFDAAISSIKTFRNPSIRKVLMYEVISETEFVPSIQGNVFMPNFFSDISNFLDKKLSVIRLYGGEMQDHPFPRSVENIKALATFRGATAGFAFAEAFMLVKEVW